MADKKYTPQEAALIVLKKAQELYSTSTLAKTQDPLNPIAGNRIKRAAGYKEQGDQKSHQIAMEGAKDAHKQRLEGIKSATKPNLEKDDDGAEMMMSEEAPMKGHIKLAKFVGRMEHKKGLKAKEMDKGEKDSERGVHSAVSSQKWGHGTSHAGSDAISATGSKRRAENGESPSPTRSLMHADAAKERAVKSHQKVLGEMKQIKPKLPG